jgi:hypothetical protein
MRACMSDCSERELASINMQVGPPENIIEKNCCSVFGIAAEIIFIKK